MTEILTESFCERCGTRYTFESARPRARLKGVKVLSRGLKNFVLSDDNSMDEAMAAARSETDRELTAHQLDAFHKTFNFCMSCRQYTCPNCWNEAEARCLTCAPHLGHEVLPAPFPDLVTSSYLVADPVDAVAANGSNGSNGAVHELVGDEAPAPGVDTVRLRGPPRGADGSAARSTSRPRPSPSRPRLSPRPWSRPRRSTRSSPDVIEDVAVEAEPSRSRTPVEAEPVAQVEVASDIPYAGRGGSRRRPSGRSPSRPNPSRVAAEDARTRRCRDRRPSRGVERRRCRHGRRPATTSRASTRRVPPRPAASSAGSAPGRTSTRSSMTTNASRPTTPPVAAELEPEVVAAAAEAIAEPEVGRRARGRPKPVAEPELVAEPEVVRRAAAAASARRRARGRRRARASPSHRRARGRSPSPRSSPPEVAAAAAAGRRARGPPQPSPRSPPPAAEPEAPAEPARPVEDVVPQPTWQTFAPDPTEIPAHAAPRSAPSIPAAASAADPNAEPQWPDQPQWPGVASPAAGLPFLNRPPTPTGGARGAVGRSAREVVAPPTVPGRPVAGAVQPCVSCGLSLSATARFCRRCGTPQAV